MAVKMGFTRLQQRLRHSLRHGLREAVIFALVLGLAIPALATVFVEHSRSVEAARRDLDHDLKRAVQILALSMQGQLWELAQENAEGVVRAMSDDARFNSVIVYDKVNERPFVELHRRAGASGETQTAEQDVELDGVVIGKVVVSMSLEPYLQASQKTQQWMMWRIALMLGVSLLLIFIVLRKRLLRPVALLTEGANRLAREDFSQPIQLVDKGELGQVATALEQMRQALVKAFSELRTKNEELTQHAALLEDRVVERTVALRHANTELVVTLETLQTAQAGLIESEKLASLGRLVAGVAHELNTPLGNALTVVSTLDEYFQNLSDALESTSLRRSDLAALVDTTREGQEILRRNIIRANDLIRDFKQLAFDQTTDLRREFDLAQVLREVLTSLQPRFKSAAVKLETRLVENVGMDSFPGPIGQVVTNLIFNALVHAFDGREHGCISLETQPLENGWVKVVCSDNGLGMSPDVRKRIFDPFFTTKLGQGGSGLGLHIVHSIVTGLLGGKIEVFTTLGEGTRFEIALPCSAPKSVSESSLAEA